MTDLTKLTEAELLEIVLRVLPSVTRQCSFRIAFHSGIELPVEGVLMELCRECGVSVLFDQSVVIANHADGAWLDQSGAWDEFQWPEDGTETRCILMACASVVLEKEKANGI